MQQHGNVNVKSPSIQRNHELKYHKINGNVKESEFVATMAYRGH
jgi:hypothetical protein